MKIIIKELKNNYNVSKQSDLKVFLKWIWIFMWLIITFFIFLLIIANILVNFISLEDEKRLFPWFSNNFNIDINKTNKLKVLLWNNFKYDISVIKDERSNAFALPWWKILITDSLLKDIKYENSLLFIIWHEIWHVENRDVLKGIISKMPIQIVLNIIWIWWDLDLSFLLSWTTDIYSKWVELDADKKWLEFLYNKKWEVWCALYFFKNDKSVLENIGSFLSDHPMNSNRIKNIENIIKSKWYKENNKCKLVD